jgi:hypothetical protein
LENALAAAMDVAYIKCENLLVSRFPNSIAWLRDKISYPEARAYEEQCWEECQLLG